MKKKTIVTFHSYVPSEFQLFNHRHPLNWLINNFLHEKVHFIAVSQYLMHVLINDLHFPKERVHVIPNSVSLPSNLSIEKARAKIDKTVIFVGRLYEPEKDVSTLLRSWQIVLKKIPDAKLLLVGDGPDCEKLKLLAFDLKIEHATTFIGEVDNVTDFIQSAAIFCLPSKFEGLSIALLECMSWAIPCVVSAIPGNQELIQHGENGLVFALGKHEELAEQLLLFLSESQFAFECGRKARLTIEKKYSTQLFIQKHIELYKNIINN